MNMFGRVKLTWRESWQQKPLCRVSSSDMRVYKINQIPDWLEQTKWERLGGYVLLSASLCVWLIISENHDKSQSIYWKRSIWTANLAEENNTEHFTGSWAILSFCGIHVLALEELITADFCPGYFSSRRVMSLNQRRSLILTNTRIWWT